MTKSIGKWLSVLVLGGSLLVSTHSPASAAVLEKRIRSGLQKLGNDIVREIIIKRL